MKLFISRQWSSVIILFLFVVLSEYLVYGGATSSGVILVRIKRFLNPEGRDAAGACCNRGSVTLNEDETVCSAPCFTMFRVCANSVDSEDVVVVEATNQGYYPPPNISLPATDPNQVQGHPIREHLPPTPHLVREPIPPQQTQIIDSRQEESFLDRLFGGGSKKEPQPSATSQQGGSSLIKQFIPVFHRRKDQPAPRPQTGRRPPGPVRRRPPGQSPAGRPPYGRPGQGAPVRQAPPRLPPYRATAAAAGGDQPDLDQWRKAGYNVIWRREDRQLFGSEEQDCSYGFIETKVLFNNSLQGGGDLLIRIPYQEEWKETGLFSIRIEAWHVQNPIQIPQIKKKSNDKTESFFSQIFSTLATQIKSNLEDFVEESLEAKIKENSASAVNVTEEGVLDLLEEKEGSGDNTTTLNTDTTEEEGSTDFTTAAVDEETTTVTEIPTTTIDDTEQQPQDNKGDKRSLILRLDRNHIMNAQEPWKEYNFQAYNARVDYSLRMVCSKDYTGDTCSFAKLCLNPALQNHPRMYCTPEGEVICREGWTGAQCQIPICKPGCHPTQGYCKQPGDCKCKTGYQGKDCEQCIRLPGCRYGTCQKGYECNCQEGYYGIFCNKPVCAEGCSEDNGFCREPNTCTCKKGWTGVNCTQCIPREGCEFGTCENPDECTCDPLYKGDLCDEPKCAKGCSSENGVCDRPGECTCKVGWKGENCTECVAYPGCLNGYCLTAWDCNCEPGWSGENCDVVEINHLPANVIIEGKCKPSDSLRCMNGGVATCIYRRDGTIVGEASCRCTTHFAGKFCQLNQKEEKR